MFIAIDLIPQWLQVSTTLITAIMLPACIRFADWRAIAQVPVRQHLLYASLLFPVLLWMISVRHIEGLLLHFAGLTTVTLLVGWRFALLIGAIATIAYTLIVGQELTRQEFEKIEQLILASECANLDESLYPSHIGEAERRGSHKIEEFAR